MKNSFFALIAPAAMALAVACVNTEAAPPQVHWSVENQPYDSIGGRTYLQTITLTGDLRGAERLCFNQFARGMYMADEGDTIVEIVPGYYAIDSPRFAECTGEDTLVFRIVTAGEFYSVAYSPDGFHLADADGATCAATLTRCDISGSPVAYVGSRNRMPDADEIFEENKNLKLAGGAGAYDFVPYVKEMKLTGGFSKIIPPEARFEKLENGREGEYHITISDNEMVVEAPEKMWPALRLRIRHFFGETVVFVPNVKMVDYPSYPYRGLMIDIARNYQTPDEIRRVLNLMATYGLNVLHFHLIDDEAWRLEIPALPELTEVGGRRGYPVGDKPAYLPQIFAGTGSPEDSEGTANGYFTGRDYVDIVRYADSLGIKVIPEVESPGHARAAIKAMELRAARLSDPSLLLVEPGDTSRYTSAQAFHDNVMNPALEGPYKLMDAVAEELISLHKQAGVPLEAIHIGGDEVPRNAWSGSPAIAELKERENLSSQKEIHAYFARRVSDMLAEKGVKTSGWQEIALRHDDEYNAHVCPNVYSVNLWSTLASQGQGSVVEDVAKAGYPVVLSNVDHFYLDMMYSYHPDERGLCWGGVTDEFSALSGYPAELCKVENANIIGVSGQVFAETIRSPQDLERMLLPKMLGLAERGWNPEKTYSPKEFQAIINREIPKWSREGYAFHVRQPGIRVVDGSYVVLNTPYRDAEIRYTLDGSRPNKNSRKALPDSITPREDARVIRAVTVVEGVESVPTVLRFD